jgi:hypothetical protein
MEDYRPRYGALTSIIDNTVSYDVKDSSENSFTFEVAPINISEAEINNAFKDTPDVWLISYTTSITPPTNNDINKAINEGLLIKISINCNIIDNFGTIHTLYYDKETDKYEIVVNRTISIPHIRSQHQPLTNHIIDYVKLFKNVIYFPAINAGSRILFSEIAKEIKQLKEIIKNQEERIKILEQK